MLAFAGGLGFAPLAGLAALPMIPGAVKRFVPRLYVAALLVFLGFAAASMAWSPSKFDMAKPGFLKIGLLLGALGVLVSAVGAMQPKHRGRVLAFARWALVTQVAIVIVLALFERQALQLFSPLMPNSGEGVQNISRNSIIMAVAAIPLLVALSAQPDSWLRAPLMIGVLLAEAGVLLLRDVEAGPIAIGAASVCVAIVRLRPRDGFRILAVGLAVLILVAPLAFDWLTHGADATKATTSAGQRLAIWANAIKVIHAHPLFGGGVGVLREMKQLIGAGMFAEQQIIPNHPHNMALQLWAEMGAVGAVLLSTAIVLAGWRLPAPRQLGPGGLAIAGLVGAASAVAFVSFDIWNEGWWGACGLLAVLCAMLVRAPDEAAVASSPAHGESNNFNLLRLAFALFVAVYHLTVLPGVPSLARFSPPLGIAAELGVQGFFVLSGYLVYASFQRSASLAVYAEKRFRRLYPAYAFVIVACVVGAIFWSYRSRENLGEVGQYLAANLVFLNFLKPELPGLFANNPLTEVNGALWTLKIEVMFYLILPALAWLIQAAGKYRFGVLAVLYVASEVWRTLFAILPHTSPAILSDLEHQLPGRLSFFLVGMAGWLLRDRIVWRWWLVAAAFAGLFLTFLSPWLLPLRAISLGFLAIWIAVGVPRMFDPARLGDLSYGIYIIHFPIIQGVVRAGIFHESPGQGVGVSALIILVVATLLWHFIERPALRRDSAYRRSAAETIPVEAAAQSR